MSYKVYLRPLAIEDANVSYKWRNDPEVWSYTKFVINNPITEEVERNWISNKMDQKNEKRFAICVKDTHEYIGNIQLLGITNTHAEFHLFIGEKKYWGKGIGYEASVILLKYAFYNLNLNHISLEVHSDNAAAFSIYSKIGFKPISTQMDFIKMQIDSSMLRIISTKY